MLVVEDLTEVVRAQRATTWREVARRLAHEIKNPLTPIQLSAERIARNIERLPAATPRITTVIRECVGLIVDEVSSLKNLVDEFVRFARLPTVARYPNSLRELVEKTMALYEGRMDGISLTLVLPDELPLVLIDPMQMKRVLINLIDNTLEALLDQPSRGLSIVGDVRQWRSIRSTVPAARPRSVWRGPCHTPPSFFGGADAFPATYLDFYSDRRNAVARWSYLPRLGATGDGGLSERELRRRSI